jgi:hypothetical protein
MSSDRLVEALKMAHHLLRQNLPRARSLTDAATVLRLRELVNSHSLKTALDRSSDTILAFELRKYIAVGGKMASHGPLVRFMVRQLVPP